MHQNEILCKFISGPLGANRHSITMVYAIKMHSICTKIKGNNFILTTLHQSKSIWYKYDGLPIWPTHIVTPIQKYMTRNKHQYSSNCSKRILIAQQCNSNRFKLLQKKNNTFPFILTTKWPLTDWFMYMHLQKSHSYLIQYRTISYLTNYIDKPIYIRAPFYTMRIFIS